jgi:5-methyltetrahydrofolate--homocysteine methyltransferase
MQEMPESRANGGTALGRHPHFDLWPDHARKLAALLEQRIVILDGAMGTMIQSHKLKEADYRGELFLNHPKALENANEVLNLARPDVIGDIHRAYLDAGADLIETNTFNANAISLGDYGLEHLAADLNTAAVRLAKAAAAAAMDRDPERPRFVAGAIGPTNRTLSLAVRVSDPAYRTHTFDQFVEAYTAQVRALLDAGADVLLVETVFDTLVAKAALFAIGQEFERRKGAVPVMLSVTITDRSGRTLSGQTVEAFWTSVSHFPLLSVGINCALGPKEMRPYVEELAGLAPVWMSCYPNAGLPDPLLPTGFPETPEIFVPQLREFAANGWLNIAGGCCGTTPEHIRALADAVKELPPRRRPEPERRTRLSGLQALTFRPDSNFILIGERTNVTGSPEFARLVKGGKLEEAVEVARQQVENGANLLDVNFDEALLDSEKLMGTFLDLIAAEPEIARVPVMIDSSRWTVLEAGVKHTQGKSVVNSISLKEGVEKFKAQARLIRSYGAAAVVMAFDERGQADTFERKIAVCERAYRILTEEVGFPAEDIILDPNILTLATGMEEHNAYAVAFLEATRWIKEHLPGARVSGGVSNLSFSFRGQKAVREAMHAAFLYHAIRAGLDLGIVNAGQLAIYEEIPAELRERVEDVIFNRRPDATERLLALAERFQRRSKAAAPEDAWRKGTVEERLAHALIHGVLDYLEDDVREALAKLGQPLAVIEGPLMAGMNVVGDLFGAGKMFLPQVVKSARVMKKAVGILEPHLEAARRGGAEPRAQGVVVMATVKGDVHDIGKNIVGAVLGCNNYRVVDLGVMAPCEKILAAAREERADLIGLSGLITPSLDQMAHVAREMQREGFAVPLLIGGATTSRAHTAIKIAPEYAGPVVHVLDASRAVGIVGTLRRPDAREGFLKENRAEQERLREAYLAGREERPLQPLAEARRRRLAWDWASHEMPRPTFLGVRALDDVPIRTLVPYMDWTPFFMAWELKGQYPKILDDPKTGPVAREVFADGQRLLERIIREKLLVARGVYGFFPARGRGDDLVLYEDETCVRARMVLHTLRQQQVKAKDAADQTHLALADFVAPEESGRPDYLGLFAVTAGHGLPELVARFKRDRDDHSAIMAEALADRLAEAFAEHLHEKARREWYAPNEALTAAELIREKYRGIRPAPGYPACPDHTEKPLLFGLLGAEKAAGITLTESHAMWPAASICGLYFGHPKARYLAVGRIGRDQAADYAARKGISLAEVEKWLAPYLGYIPGKETPA